MSTEPELVIFEFRCPRCGEREIDRLAWVDDDVVKCETCEHEYNPGAMNDASTSEE